MKLHGCGKTTDREKYFNAFAIHRTLDCHRTTPRVELKKFLIGKTFLDTVKYSLYFTFKNNKIDF